MKKNPKLKEFLEEKEQNIEEIEAFISTIENSKDRRNINNEIAEIIDEKSFPSLPGPK